VPKLRTNEINHLRALGQGYMQHLAGIDEKEVSTLGLGRMNIRSPKTKKLNQIEVES